MPDRFPNRGVGGTQASGRARPGPARRGGARRETPGADDRGPGPTIMSRRGIYVLMRRGPMKRSAVAALLAALSAGPLLPAGAAEKDRLVPSITVVGSGKVTARPDMAELQMGVLAQAESAAKALKENSEAMDRLLKTLEGQGIAKKDVQTSNFSVSPQYKQVLPRPGEAPQRPEIVG